MGELVTHLAMPRADDPNRSSDKRLCDGGPALDVPDAKAVIDAWKKGGWKAGEAAVPMRWISTSDAGSVTCPACREHPKFKGYGRGLEAAAN